MFKVCAGAMGAMMALAGAANALTVGVAGSDHYSSFLNANGHASSGITAATDLTGFDVVILNRTSGWTGVVDFVNAGGLLITEWSASTWALNTAGLLDAADLGGGELALDTPITFTAAGLAAGLGDLTGPTFSDGDGTQYFRSYASIGASVEVLATRPGGIAVTLGGGYGAGHVLIMGYDWGDNLYSGAYVGAIDTPSEQALISALSYASADVPVPAAAPLLAFGIAALGFLRRRKT